MNLQIAAIENGTVIDHIPSKLTIAIFKMLRLANIEDTISIAFNLKSSTLGAKGIIKLEGKHFTSAELNKISLIAPNATMNIIKDFKVTEKIVLSTPERIEEVIICPNFKCISRNEKHLHSLFHIQHTSSTNFSAKCHYCERDFTQEEILQSLFKGE